MIPKSGTRLSDKIMRKQSARAGCRLQQKSSRTGVGAAVSGCEPAGVRAIPTRDMM
jgi:hypothetical protein